MLPDPPSGYFTCIVQSTCEDIAMGAFVFINQEEWFSDKKELTLLYPTHPGTPNMDVNKVDRENLLLVAGVADLTKALDPEKIKNMSITDILKKYFPADDITGLELSLLRRFELYRGEDGSP